MTITGSNRALAQQGTSPTATSKYKDNVDDRMKGPNGEKIYIGEKGGRYYLKDGKKVYVAYKRTKKKKKTT
ncbi:MAG: hypothetical protein A1D16_13625 [Flavihumibacter sp. CACIAM 22H1]|nr:MAG: hypothetical protein A1D16_13625 [Flavihumibacter sp. CACIAM 22H1]